MTQQDSYVELGPLQIASLLASALSHGPSRAHYPPDTVDRLCEQLPISFLEWPEPPAIRSLARERHSLGPHEC
jgi:hypothetical protein